MRSGCPDRCFVMAQDPRVSGRQRRQPDASSGADIRKLLASLAGGAYIASNNGRGFLLIDKGTPRSGAPKPVSRRIVDACVAADWLVGEQDRFVLSDVGRARVRRLTADGNDPFQAQHQRRKNVLQEIGGVRRAVLVNEAESPLGWLRSRKDRNGRALIGEPQFEAGERLRADYWFAQMSPRVTANWASFAPQERSSRGAPASAGDLRDEVFAAKNRVMKALGAVGPETSGVLVDICCELKGLEEAEKQNGWPQRAGKVVLQIALTRLAKHYGLISEDRGRRGNMRHWGEAGYRPRIDGAAEDAESSEDAKSPEDGKSP